MNEQPHQNGQIGQQDALERMNQFVGGIALLFERHGMGLNTPIAAPVIDPETDEITGTENCTGSVILMKILNELQTISYQLTIQTGISFITSEVTEDEALEAVEREGEDEDTGKRKRRSTRKR